jgi:hypothetical protein
MRRGQAIRAALYLMCGAGLLGIRNKFEFE